MGGLCRKNKQKHAVTSIDRSFMNPTGLVMSALQEQHVKTRFIFQYFSDKCFKIVLSQNSYCNTILTSLVL